MQHHRSECDADVASEHVRSAPSGYDHFGSIPSWPDRELDIYVSDGLRIRGFWTNLDNQVYKLVQSRDSIPKNDSGIGERFLPQIWLLLVKGRPKPGPRDWTLHQLATYDLPEIPVGIEAPEEIAAFRRRLPELLAELPKRQAKASGLTARDDGLD
jgi:hypothetical protein